MSDDPILDQFKYWGGADEESWNGFLTGFSMKSQAARIHDVEMVDTWLAQQTTLTREHASLVTRKRELLSVHRKLQELGR
jgi:hypothetical protein